MKYLNPYKTVLLLLMLLSQGCLAGYWSTIINAGSTTDHNHFTFQGQIFKAMLEDFASEGIVITRYKVEQRATDIVSIYTDDKVNGTGDGIVDGVLITTRKFEINFSFEFPTQTEQAQFNDFVSANVWSSGTIAEWLSGIDFGEDWSLDGASALISESGTSAPVWENLFETRVSRDEAGVPLLDGSGELILIDTTHQNDYFWQMAWQYELEPSFDLNTIWYGLSVFAVMSLDWDTSGDNGVTALQFPMPVYELDEDGYVIGSDPLPYTMYSESDPRNLMPTEIRQTMQVEMNSAVNGYHEVQVDIYYYFGNQSAALAMDQNMLDEVHVVDHVGEQSQVAIYQQGRQLTDFAGYQSLHNTVGTGHLGANNFNDPTPQYLFAGSGPFGRDINVTSLNFIAGASTSYSLGGVVNGLNSGDSVILQNNLTDDKTILIDGNFTFDTVLPNGTDYAVTVLTQPTSTAHICTVSGGNSGNNDGAGTITDANDTSIIIDCNFTCESIQPGPWSDVNTWTNCNAGIPGDGDLVLINAGHTVNLNQNTALLEGISVAVGGDFEVGAGSFTLFADASGAEFDLQNASIELSGDLTIDANAHKILLGSVNGGYGLTLNSSVETRFLGAIGAASPLSSLTTDSLGTTVFADTSSTNTNANMIVDGPIAFNNPILVARYIHISGNSDSITFDSTIDSEAGNVFFLIKNVQNANIEFNGDVGTIQRLSAIVITNSETSTVHLNAANFLAIKSLSWRTNVVLGAADITLNTNEPGIVQDNYVIMFGNSSTNYLHSQVAGGSSLTIEAIGTTYLNAVIGGDNLPLANLSINQSASIVLKSSAISVADTITLGAPVTMTAASVLEANIVDIQSTVDNGGFDLTVDITGANNLSQITGVLSGAGDFIKKNSGRMSLVANNTFTGKTLINGGVLKLLDSSNDNSISASTEIEISLDASLTASNITNLTLPSGQTLSGAGLVFNKVTALSGSIVAPGLSVDTGMLFTFDVVIEAGAQLQILIEGTTAGNQYDQLSVSGSVDISGATLAVTESASLMIGDQIIIIDNDRSDAVVGTFNTLAEGSQFITGDYIFSISYVGGDGNDVVLTVLGSSILYVDHTPTPISDGQNWDTAFEYLQDALAVAVPGMQIWVAQGVYYPDESASPIPPGQEVTFSLIEGVNIYGGFAGNETDLSQRNPVINTTILSGDIDGNDSDLDNNNIAENVTDIQGNNAYHVLNGQNLSSSTIFDGFTVTAGNASIPDPIDGHGGGMICNDIDGPSINQLVFIGNSSILSGGASRGCDANVTNSQYISNQSSNGGAVYSTSARFQNVLFKGNSSNSQSGGALVVYGNLYLENVLFSGNDSADAGGAIYVGDSGVNGSLTLVNVTMSGNKSNAVGGSLKVISSGTVDIVNSIIWNNQYGPINGTALASIDSNLPINNSYSLIQGFGLTGIGNLDEDPLFITDTDPTTAPTILGNARLMDISIAIDAGDNTLVTRTTDIDGSTRIFNGTVDMGAYEFFEEQVFKDGFE